MARAPSDMPRVSVRAAAPPGAAPCPACDDPLFPDLEAEDELAATERCETCGVVVSDGGSGGHNRLTEVLDRIAELQPGQTEMVTFPNVASVQAMFGAESWALLDRSPGAVNLTPDGVRRRLRDRGARVASYRSLARPGMGAMWLTIVNLLTFRRNFAPEALSGRLRPQGGADTAKFVIDAAISILVAIPVAGIAVLLEGISIAAGRGGQVELAITRD